MQDSIQTEVAATTLIPTGIAATTGLRTEGLLEGLRDLGLGPMAATLPGGQATACDRRGVTAGHPVATVVLLMTVALPAMIPIVDGVTIAIPGVTLGVRTSTVARRRSRTR